MCSASRAWLSAKMFREGRWDSMRCCVRCDAKGCIVRANNEFIIFSLINEKSTYL